MAKVNITGLPNLTTMTDASLIPADDSGTTYHISGSTLKEYTNSTTGNITANNIITNTIVPNGSGNIYHTGNLLPSNNNFNLGLPTVPWQNAYFGSQSITILDTVSGNLANAVTIENSSGDISMGTAAFTIGALGNNTPVFTIAALSGQIYSNAETIINNATNAANTTSGSLQTAGGAGIVKDLYVGGNVSIGDVDEDGSIIINGTTYDSQFTINAIGGNVPAQFILHRHSTTQEPVFAGARSNTDDLTESSVTNGMPLLSIYGAGWTGPDYQIFSGITLGVDNSGNVSGNISTPGRITFATSSDGSASNLYEALNIRNDQSSEFVGNVVIDTYINLPNNLILGSGVPANSYGQAGDVQGMFAIDNNYIYYCTQDYVDSGHQDPLTTNAVPVDATYGAGLPGAKIGYTGPYAWITTGQSFDHGGNTYVLQTVVNSTGAGAYIIVSPPMDAYVKSITPVGTILNINDGAPQTNIWNRTAQTGGTW